jgi:LacI family transcriptional regulator
MSVRAKDIAQKLGVSTTTVSLVINNKPGVSKKTRERVLKEIETMGFETNIKLKQTTAHKNIRFILFKSHGLVVGDTPFFSKLIESIEGEARENGFNIIISYLNKESNTSAYINQFENDENTAGILLLATEMSEEDIITFTNSEIPDSDAWITFNCLLHALMFVLILCSDLLPKILKYV